MAITGSGTAASPYIVTTAEELKDAMETHHSTGDYLCVELGNTIDLQYSNFETIQTSDQYDHIDLNLAGYAIQNIFAAAPVFQLQKADHIHNGRLLNILTASNFNSEYFIQLGFFEKVSFSTYADVPTYSMFHSARFKQCALGMRYKYAQPIDDGTIFKSIVLRGADTTAESSMIDECDIMLAIDEFKSVDAEFIAQGAGASNIINSRIMGGISVYNNSDAQYYPKLSGINMVNSAVNFAVPNYSGTATPGASHYFVKGHYQYKTLVNTEVLPAYTSPIDNGCVACTSTEWTNATTLTGKGFEVYGAGTK